MEVWRSSSKDRVGLFIISVMLSICTTVVVLLYTQLLYNSGTDRKKRREKVEKSVVKMWKKKTEGGKAQTYRDKIKKTLLGTVNEH